MLTHYEQQNFGFADAFLYASNYLPSRVCQSGRACGLCFVTRREQIDLIEIDPSPKKWFDLALCFSAKPITSILEGYCIVVLNGFS